MKDVNFTNKPSVLEWSTEEDWSGLVVGTFTAEVAMKAVPVKPNEEYYSKRSDY